MKEQRKILKVKHQFQDKMILEVILIAFIFINVLITVMFTAYESIKDVESFKTTLIGALILAEMGGFALVYVYALKASHRIAGPVYAVERRLKQLAEGDLVSQLTLRDKDNFFETADTLNQSVDALRLKLVSLRDNAKSLKEDLTTASQDSSALEQFLAEIETLKLDHDWGDEQKSEETPGYGRN